ncbi:hypothetical protein CFAM422_006848 [Trichoderma lentiforme]|uniref:Uncharacterized protein n=1 Tax=Trichoderma lentiforme TaxID=1567552 RepID=A0A9P4XF97_9HYPO|nr:hypothetical protein CFAM422_006848 [Trichoderma lentiforme]
MIGYGRTSGLGSNGDAQYGIIVDQRAFGVSTRTSLGATGALVLVLELDLAWMSQQITANLVWRE